MARRRSTPLPEFTAHAATTPPENPDLLEQLSFEHRQLQRLWTDLQLAHKRHIEEDYRPGAALGLAGQRSIGAQIIRLLAEHEARELELLYPVGGPVVGDGWAARAVADHADVRDLLDEVDGENPEDEGVFEIYTEVLTKMLAHIDEEENVVFPMLRTMVPATALADPGPRSGAEAQGPREVVDLAAAERAMADATAGGGGGRSSRSSRALLRLRRR